MFSSYSELNVHIVEFDRVGDHGVSHFTCHIFSVKYLEFSLGGRELDLVPTAECFREEEEVLEMVEAVGD